MKIIFLDVDGVLNSQKSYIELENNKCGLIGLKLYPEYLKNLKLLVEKFNCKIVISSSWRCYPKQMKILNEYLLEYNIFDNVIGITPQIYTNGAERGDEIRKWLQSYNNKDKIETFVILDDDSDMKEFTDIYLAKTDWKTGFTVDILEKAKIILETTTYKKENINE